MTDFQAVNATSVSMDQKPRPEASTPTTPRPSSTGFSSAKSQDVPGEVVDMEDAKTPTRESFAGMVSQKPLPSSPLQSHSRADSKMDAPAAQKREGSSRATQSTDEHQDTEMADAKDGAEASGDESNSDERPSKKKKGQRFFCTDFPPCNLSFTRSEHLARHIRKHTGERPFQCHCSRRFSRLDNLRQHAQTVHVNEDIPGDSLAATGTRFQRQIRTDRVRPAGARSRASTLGSGGGHSRGHSRNLSSSSITSVASTVSSMGGEDVMRRSTPVVTGERTHRSRLSLDTFGSTVTGSPAQQHFFPPPSAPGAPGTQSPSGYSTPTSTTFSQGTGSPRFSSGFHSPASTSIPRSVTFEPRTPGRRLSVPSAAAFTPPSNSSYTSPYHSSVHSASGNSSVFASPGSSGFGHSRAESASSIDVDLKRRTWHPNVNTGLVPRPGASGLQQYQAPEQPRPLFASDKPSTGPPTLTLPGIESFDHAPPLPNMPRRVLSPMQIDPPQPQSLSSAVSQSHVEPRDNRLSWDSTLQRGLSSIELERASQQAERGQASFGPVATHAPDPPRPSTSHVTFQEPPRTSLDSHRNRLSDDGGLPSRKRMAWYNGPVQHQGQSPYAPSSGPRTSPDESGSSDGVPTPGNSALHEANPAIVHSNGYVEQRPLNHPVHELPVKMHGPPPHYTPSFASNSIPQYTPYQHLPHQAQNATYALHQAQQAPGQTYQRPATSGNDMQRLEALVAVATQENRVVSGR
ncbi:uncharacterized protein PV09_03526 [Verruconis gallopava]|uniref:C2H2-type domain-containing protein n=1 Tax=Verruconis gallopava TaxID=253628 RepID=A0A0D1YY87_9PEZI|nr:uncharacterized protein PV09_03526 [Verruconis gallopava]KIW05662.1 hypothetical protein PV09_03526 [Verruconis gallopava]